MASLFIRRRFIGDQVCIIITIISFLSLSLLRLLLKQSSHVILLLLDACLSSPLPRTSRRCLSPFCSGCGAAWRNVEEVVLSTFCNPNTEPKRRCEGKKKEDREWGQCDDMTWIDVRTYHTMLYVSQERHFACHFCDWKKRSKKWKKESIHLQIEIGGRLVQVVPQGKRIKYIWRCNWI